ncbi:MAG: hypothetical protein J6N46_03705 [Bacteroidales bacterium]|nr:hypothetical protein [Bacteroidales bacterium]
MFTSLTFGTMAWGQSDRWDRALDSYQTICDRCILLREQSLRGDEIPADELRSLLEQVSSLRASLQRGSGSMSKAQKERFERIRSRYVEAFSKQGYSTDGPVLRIARPVLDLPRVDWSPQIKAGERSRTTVGERSRTMVGERSRTTGPSAPLRDRSKSTGLMAMGSWIPNTLSYGAMATLTWGKAGIYAKGRSNFQNKIGEYSCLSDGTSGGKVIWTSGQESHPTWALGAGGIFKIAGPVGLYVGSGYGSAQTLWEDASGKWATVEDYSAKGICADAGIIFSKNHFQASIGISTITFKKPALELGLGIRF